MTRYVAEWTDPHGLQRRLELEAASRPEALSQLPPDARSGLRRLVSQAAREDHGDVAQLARFLAGLLRRGVPLGAALREWSLGRLTRAAAQADEGASLADALAAEGGAFATPAVRALLAADRAGPTALEALADVSSELELARARLSHGLAYPLLLASFGVTLLALVLSVVARTIPTSVTLGWTAQPTWVSQALSLTQAEPWAPAAAAALALVLLWSAWAVIPGWWSASLRAPRCRRVLSLRLLGALIAQGTPVTEAWEALGHGLSLPGARALPEGGSPVAALEAAGLVRRSEALGLAAAERAGPEALAEELAAVARDLLAEEAARARRTGFLLEVLLLVLIGAGVLAVAAGMLPLRWMI
ncbi:MAG: type II secretion system F family protein [Planctomycetota bacterium]